MPTGVNQPTDAEEPIATLVQRLRQEGEPLTAKQEIWEFLSHVSRADARIWLEKARIGGTDMKKRQEHLRDEAEQIAALQKLLGTRLSNARA